EAVGVDRPFSGLADVAALDAGRMLHAGDDVGPVGVEMSAEVELVTGGQQAAIALGFDDQSGSRFFLNAYARGALVVLKDPLQVPGLGGPARIDPVEALGVAAGKVIVLQAPVRAHLELVGHRAGLHGIRDWLRRLEIVVGKLKAVVAKRLLGGAN